MKLAVIGTGYVGLVTGTCFADRGNDVTCIDIDPNKINKLSNGKITFFEPGLETLYLHNLQENRLNFTTDIQKGIADAQVIFLALPTPPQEDGSADLKYVLEVATILGKLLNKYTVIVNKSTVPVGTAQLVFNSIQQHYNGDFDVVSNPEFLKQGDAVEGFNKPDRVVIGSSSNRAITIMKELYEPFVKQGNPIIIMDEKSAELTKYAANSFLATKISFMNEIANLSEILGTDIDMVRRGMGSDERIGKRFLFAGIGFGGSCFPKDVLALNKTSQDANYSFNILDAVLKVNKNQKNVLVQKLKEHFNKQLTGKKVALWGLSFKPNTDDIREAPSITIINELLLQNVTVTVYDPEAIENVKLFFGDKINYATSKYEALEGVDALLIATEWNEFKTPDFEKIKILMPSKLIFDGRNLYTLEQMKRNEFTYYSIGREVII